MKQRAEFMSTALRTEMKGKPRSHAVCKAIANVFRPGKTAKDRANRMATPKK